MVFIYAVVLRVHPIPTVHPCSYLFFWFFVATLCVNKDVYKTSHQTCDAYQTEVQIQMQDYEQRLKCKLRGGGTLQSGLGP